MSENRPCPRNCGLAGCGQTVHLPGGMTLTGDCRVPNWLIVDKGLLGEVVDADEAYKAFDVESLSPGNSGD